MSTDILLIGGGGHCESCIDVIEQQGEFSIIGIIDTEEKLHTHVLGYEVISTDKDLPKLVGDGNHFLITLGQIKSPARRMELFSELKRLGAVLPAIISPSAYVSQHARIGEGSVVMHHALVNAGAEVGKNCIINTKALIEHGAEVGDHCHIATSSVVNGGTKIGSGSFLGTHSGTREYVRIGDNTIIGGGEFVYEDVASNSIYKTRTLDRPSVRGAH